MRQSGDHSDIVVGCLEIVYPMPLFPPSQTGEEVPETLALQNESLIQLKNSPRRYMCTLPFELNISSCALDPPRYLRQLPMHTPVQRQGLCNQR